MTTYALTDTQALAALRIDLADTDPTTYRWSDDALNRAIDLALEQLSAALPLVQSQQLIPAARCPFIAAPDGCLGVQAVEYPTEQFPRRFVPFLERRSPLLPAPVAAGAEVLTAPGGALQAATYTWYVTHAVPGGGETTTTPLASAVAAAGDTATLYNIPTGPSGVIARNIYRQLGPGAIQLAGSLPDNSSATFIDSGITAGANAPTANTTAGIDYIQLQLPPELLPDGSQTAELTYSTKHQLDGSGTTVPQRHWDALFLGAVAHAMWSYLPTVNDNFEYADGHLRDRVDDTASTTAWQTQCFRAMTDWEKRLATLREESSTWAAYSHILHWGDKPVRYDRL